MKEAMLVLGTAAAAATIAIGLHRAPEVQAEAPTPPEPVVVTERAEPIVMRVMASRATAPEVVEAPTPPRPVAAPRAPQQSQETRRRRSSRSSRSSRYTGRVPTPSSWSPPAGPVRIALQAGHWRADEAPRELRGLRDNGTAWRDMPEWEVNLGIAREAAEMLEAEGYEVDVLPAVVPPGYRAHLFIAIHADGAADPAATGYRVASPRRDATGRADDVARLLADTYGDATGIRRLPDTTRRMRNYYAFNYRRYQHALHPATIGVILETGFLTSAADRRVIVDDQQRAARGIVEAVRRFPVTADPDGQ